MKVIALKENANKGKSMTLNIVYHRLIALGAFQHGTHFRELGAAVQRDFLDVLNYKGKLVGFATMGDWATKKGVCVKDLLAELGSYGCDVAVTACRNTGGTFTAVQAYPTHVVIPKTLALGPSDERICNVQDALVIESTI